MRKLLVTVVVLVGVVAAPYRVAAEEAGLAGDPGKEAEFVALINELRADHGLAPLEVHGELTAKARDWSRTMAAEGDIWHSDLPDGVTADWQRLGENVGMGGSVPALHQAFVDSPSHFENLVDPGFRHVGLGVTVDAEGTIFVSEVFMELASRPAPPASSPTTGPAPEPAAAPAPAAAPVATPSAPPAPPAPVETADTEVASRIDSVLERLRALDS